MGTRSSGSHRVTYADFLRTGPGTLAGRYLRRFWQPVQVSRELQPGQAKPIRIMSEDFTLYRGEDGAPHLLDFRCAHRGTQLSTGWVEGDCIRCFYHGWKYDGSGQCVEQPAEDASFASKVRIRSYPLHETAGLLFAYFGEPELQPPPPYFPEFEEGYAAQAYAGIWPCNYFTQLDNAVDTLHTTFVHWQFGRGVQTLKVEPLGSGLVVYPHGPGAGYPNFFHMPNSHEWATPPPRGQTVWDFTKGWRVPVEDHHHARFDVSVMPLRGAEGEAYLASWGHKGTEATTMDVVRAILAGESTVRAAEGRSDLILIQDLVALMGLGPIADQTPQERLGRSDAGVILMRKLWQEELQALADGRPLRHWDRPANPVWSQLKARTAGTPARVG